MRCIHRFEKVIGRFRKSEELNEDGRKKEDEGDVKFQRRIFWEEEGQNAEELRETHAKHLCHHDKNWPSENIHHWFHQRPNTNVSFSEYEYMRYTDATWIQYDLVECVLPHFRKHFF